jgi:hypothetical protein
MKLTVLILAFMFAALAQQPTPPTVTIQAKPLELVHYKGISANQGGSSTVKRGIFSAKVTATATATAVMIFAGAASPAVITDHRPVIEIRLPAGSSIRIADAMIARVDVKGDHRELPYAHATSTTNARGNALAQGRGSNSVQAEAHVDTIATTLAQTGDQTYTLTPKEDLQPGEYLIYFNQAHLGGGFDFTIK